MSSGSDGSKIFSGFRALGYVCDHLPFSVRRHQTQKENYVVASIGRAFHVYRASKLAIVSVSDLHDADITAITSDDALVYTASATVVRAFRVSLICQTGSSHCRTRALQINYE